MSFFQDLIAGRGELHESVTPSWLRKAAPKELQPNGFMPLRDWFGIDGDGSLKAAAKAKEQQRIAAEQAYGQSLFNQAGSMSVPGATAQMNAVVPGLLSPPPQQPEPTPNEMSTEQQPVGEFYPLGPYAIQAMQMSGLLGDGSAGSQSGQGLLARDDSRRPWRR